MSFLPSSGGVGGSHPHEMSLIRARLPGLFRVLCDFLKLRVCPFKFIIWSIFPAPSDVYWQQLRKCRQHWDRGLLTGNVSPYPGPLSLPLGTTVRPPGVGVTVSKT